MFFSGLLPVMSRTSALSSRDPQIGILSQNRAC